ncbi:LD-carboxypeptidase [Kribbella sp. NPDC005582]|uniref:S66 peptidase family protein n=1 Tax=Kribbella sp. NPDC005582 TaxID=3156893 RepID=UPI0033BDAAB5
MTETIVPRPLQVGDRIAVVAPSGRIRSERLDQGLEYLKAWGLEVDVMPFVLAGHDRFDYLAAADDARAADLRDAWLDDRFAAVFCGRGGYGVQRMVDAVDFDELAAVPKWFVGFSDITALHEPLNARGLVTIHGPMAAAVEQLGVAEGRARLHDLLFEPDSVTDLLAPRGARSVVGGVVDGVLRGGNLALLAGSIGTPTYAPPSGIVVLEDVGEHGYRIDRLLTQLLRAGWFEQVTGLVIGDFTDSDDAGLAADVVRERLEPLGLPMVEGAGIGHEDLNLAVPLGLPVRLDATAATLTPLWPGAAAGS